MKKFCIVVTFMMLALTGFAQGFRNPVLPGFHADGDSAPKRDERPQFMNFIR